MVVIPEFNFSAGPWEIIEDWREYKSRSWDTEAEMVLVGYDVFSKTTLRPVITCEGIEACEPHAKENVHLIVAAPELVDILCRLVCELDRNVQNNLLDLKLEAIDLLKRIATP